MKYGIGPAGRIYAAALIVAVLCAGPASEYRAVYAEDLSVLKGSITDVRGRPVEGAMVFVYVNSDVRRSAEFISAPADAQGRYRMTVPAGTYWVVARLKKTEGFGPLMPGDKHSGEPREVELLVGSDREADFVVADLRDAISMKKERYAKSSNTAGNRAWFPSRQQKPGQRTG